MNRQTILITGASSGLGAGMAREFAKRGHSLALCARRLQELQALREELLQSNSNIRVEVLECDVRDYQKVFEVFRAFEHLLGRLDRVIVNAGIGDGVRIGTGGFETNRRTAEVNFVAALAQCEAAMEIFRKQGHGHLVAMSSMSAMRGLRGSMTTYAASKAALAALMEGIRMDLLNTPIKVSTLYAGYIATPLNENAKRTPFRISLKEGSHALVVAIERESAELCVPAWPWAPLGLLMRNLPLSLVARIT